MVDVPGETVMNTLVDPSIQSTVVSAMSVEAGAASSRRVIRADQLAADANSMWAVALTTPTVFAGMGFRVAQQSAGYPANTGTGTGGEK